MIISDYFYICHYCIDYKTIHLSDMIRHFKRKNKCKNKTLFSFEESIILSKNKKYEFNNVNINDLSINDIIFIITYYDKELNIINTNFKNNIQNNIINTIFYENDNNQLTKISNNLIPVKIDGYLYKNLYNNIYINTNNNKYYCSSCDTEYANINSMRRHLLSNVCTKKQKINTILKK
jgi:hypothetical protein